jgi:restriction system protein
MKKATISPTKQVAAKVIYEAFKILKEAGGELPGREVVEQIEKRVTFTPWELERYQKTGYIRWQSILHFYTIDCIKAGFLRKQSGIWILTGEGEKALPLGPDALLDNARMP